LEQIAIALLVVGKNTEHGRRDSERAAKPLLADALKALPVAEFSAIEHRELLRRPK
jgi:hypothetical protein